MSVYCVSGGLGFIGSHLVDALIERGDTVHIIDNLSTGKVENLNPKAHFTKLDLRDADGLEECIAKIKPEKVFHLAALARIQPSILDPIRWNQNNADATLNLLWACKNNGVKKVVFSGSSSLYGDNPTPFVETQIPMPKNPYALSKSMCEQWCKLFSELYGLDVTILRYFNIFGKRQVLEGDYATVIGIFMKQAADGKNLTIVGDGEQSRDLTYVKDAVRANILASEHKGFGTYNIGTGTTHKIKDVAKMVQPDESKHTYGIKRSTEAKVTLANNMKAREELGWEPEWTLEAGIADILKK